ncbi:MAG: methyltransferase [Chloroflexaceae bacterium]|nr:methyltransferase [Chloroflexaceae bacterium]
MIDQDPYYKKRILYAWREQRFTFDVAHTLFSSFQVDEGTDLLLRTIDIAAPSRIIDLGCGCGVIGIVLARRFAQAEVLMLDKDLLAVRYATHNARLNRTPNTTVIGSVALEQAPPGPYDLIVSNIPAKIGDAAIEQEFVLKPLQRLAPGGEYWFVVVSGLNRLIPSIGTRNQLRLKELKKRSGHTVYRLRQSERNTKSLPEAYQPSNV